MLSVAHAVGSPSTSTRYVCIFRDVENYRINVILPTATVAVLDKVAAKGNRSALIDRAIRHYVEALGRQNLREQLKQEAPAHAERDLSMASHPGGLPKRSAVIVNQVGSVYRQRLGKRLGKLSRQSIVRVDQVNRISLGLIAFLAPPIPRSAS
jgi:hypothetical protein